MCAHQALKGKFYRTVVRSTLLYESEFWAAKKNQGHGIQVEEMGILECKTGYSQKGRIRKDYIKGILEVSDIGDKMREN